jgi:hypothetical protein
MADISIKKELRSAAKALVHELQSRSLPGVRLAEGLQIEKTYTRGYAATLGSLGRSRYLELWLDRYLDRPEPFFWFGFGAKRPAPIQELVKALPRRLEPQVFLGTDDTKEVDGSQSALKKRLSDDGLQKVIQEDYPRADMYSLGKYERAHSPLKNGSRLDVSRAASFLYEVATAFADNSKPPNGIGEGACGQVTTNKYERDPKAREACLDHFGYRCRICNMSFEEVYGRELGSEFIHVHHIEGLSGGERVTDPKKDLVPVCPNCHAMLHKENPPMLPEALAYILAEQKKIAR